MRIGQSELRWLGGLAGLILLFGIGWYFWDQETFEEWKKTLHPSYFLTLLVILPPIGIPTTPFFLIAGAVFPTPTAIMVCAGGILGNNLICWWLAHGFLKERVHQFLKKWIRQPQDPSKSQKWKVAIVLKFAPGLPAFVRNYGLSLSGLRLYEYLIFNVSISSAFAIGLILLGESFIEQNWKGALLAAIIIIVFLLFARYMRSRIRQNRDPH